MVDFHAFKNFQGLDANLCVFLGGENVQSRDPADPGHPVSERWCGLYNEF